MDRIITLKSNDIDKSIKIKYLLREKLIVVIKCDKSRVIHVNLNINGK